MLNLTLYSGGGQKHHFTTSAWYGKVQDRDKRRQAEPHRIKFTVQAVYDLIPSLAHLHFWDKNNSPACRWLITSAPSQQLPNSLDRGLLPIVWPVTSTPAATGTSSLSALASGLSHSWDNNWSAQLWSGLRADHTASKTGAIDRDDCSLRGPRGRRKQPKDVKVLGTSQLWQ